MQNSKQLKKDWKEYCQLPSVVADIGAREDFFEIIIFNFFFQFNLFRFFLVVKARYRLECGAVYRIILYCLQNMRSLGLEDARRKKEGLDKEHIFLVLKWLAGFHAASYCLLKVDEEGQSSS